MGEKKKKDMLIVMSGLGSGGAEKSLVSFLTALKASHDEDVNIDLLVFRPEGLFKDQIPEGINWIYTPKECFCMSHSVFKKLFWKNITVKGIAGKVCHYLRLPMSHKKGLDSVQTLWQHWKPFIPVSQKHYDVAISYMHGTPNYFVIDKCNADKKYVYIHHEYEKIKSNRQFDRAYFSKADAVITVSDKCVESIDNVFPELKQRVVSIENIVSASLIESLAKEYKPVEFMDIPNAALRIVSIGRLNRVKRFDRAIEAASILKDKKIEFKWVLVGTGELKDELKLLIKKNGLQHYFILAGEKSNPYPYIYNADVFVQTSDNEGKSIVIDEAKILHKPIVVTNYLTVSDEIQHEKNGLISDFTPESVVECICRYVSEPQLKESVVSELKTQKFGNEEEIEKFFELWND